MRVLTVDEIPRSTVAAWQLELAVYAERRTRQGGDTDIAACSRTARAELWRYHDPGHPDDGTWSFQLIDRPWPTPVGEAPSPQWLQGIGALESFATWRECFDAAFAAVRVARGCA